MEHKDYLKSKIAIPKIVNNILLRQNVLDILNNSAPDEAICFVAPYGYGKTLSVASWLRERRRDAAWITLDASDNSERVFYAGLSAALMRFAGWRGDVKDVLLDDKFGQNPREFLWQAISRAESSGWETILVIDNFHFIRDRELLHSIKNMISELLGRWKVIVMNRAELPAFFSELVLRGRVRLVTPRELNFDVPQIMQFFSMNGCTATEQDILKIKSETEGWPASLNVILTISRGGAAMYGEAVREYIVRFFETEIWEYLQDNIKDFLLKTCILDKLTPASCRVVADIGETLPIMRWLHVNGLFISKLDEKDTYRYQRVFRDFLLDKLDDSDIDQCALYRKLGWRLFDEGQAEQSFPCFFKAGDLYGVSEALKVVNPSSMDSIESYLKLAECVTQLDVASLKPYPIIVARIAMIHFLTGDVARMQSLHQLFRKWSDPGTLQLSQEDYAEFLWETGWLHYLDPDETTIDNHKHLDWINYKGYLPRLEELQVSRTSVLYFPSMLRGVRDYGNDGLFQIESVMSRIEDGEKNIVDNKESRWLAYLLMAEYHYERERFREAESIIRTVMPQVEECRVTFIYMICTALLVKIIRAVHNPNEIGALVNRLEGMIVKNGHKFLLPNFHALEQRNYLADGHCGFMPAFERENNDYEDKSYFYLIYRHFTFVRTLLSIGSHNRAMLILGNLEILCKKYKRPTDLIEVNILKSIVLYSLGYEEEACAHLTEAIQCSERYGFIRIFSDDAKEIWPILQLARRRISGKHVQNIAISCKKSLARIGKKPVGKKYAHMQLTKTELKILKLLQSGMSYEEIALDSDVRLSTVKSHLHSIYSKLEVHDKTSAIIMAKSMGILE